MVKLSNGWVILIIVTEGYCALMYIFGFSFSVL